MPHRLPKYARRKRWYQRRWFKVTVVCVVAFLGALLIVAEYTLQHAAPILRKKVIETLSQRFNVPVQLDSLDISLVKGIQVTGGGLRIPYREESRPAGSGPAPVLLKVDHFAFRSTWKGVLHSITRIENVYVEGMTIDLPPDRHNLLGSQPDTASSHPKAQPKLAILVNTIHCQNTKLIIENGDPNKNPKEFDISDLVLHDVGRTQPFTYDAHMTNPIPKGDIHAEGHFGPWNADEPRQTQLDGKYTFSHADMNTIKGLDGTLSSTGQFSGVLERIEINGTTETPNFSLDVANHPMNLATKFHAFVDGTSGDTYLQPVEARLGETNFTCSGKVVDLKHKGHDIALDVVMPHGRIQDLLRLATKSLPPMMRGTITMKSKLHIPPGQERVETKLDLAGHVRIVGVQFSNPKVQDKIDSLSLRAQGHPKESPIVGSDRAPEVASTIDTDFYMGHGQMTFPKVRYVIPGATVNLHGVYSIPQDAFEFKGHVLTQATASQMVTGWKHWLLKPVDPFLKKDGAGLELPISISGRKSDVHFGLAMHGSADETPSEMRQDIRDRASGKNRRK